MGKSRLNVLGVAKFDLFSFLFLSLFTLLKYIRGAYE